MSSRRSPRAVPALVLLGVLVVQTAWILAVPPFKGYDEFDHAYRAAAVARGEWRAEGVSPNGRGGLVTVPRDIVEAAHAQCSVLKYTKPDNCRPVPGSTQPDGLVRVASGASRYHPAFYWVVGTVARPFNGASALYAMRFTAATLCALGMAIAVWCLRRRGTGRWPLAGLLLAVTPVFAYSTTLPAPNGLEMVAGVVLWSALLALDRHRRPGDGWVIAWIVLAAGLLVTLRSLGPLFAALIVLCVVVLRRQDVAAIWRAHSGPLLTGTVVTAALAAGSVWWILVQAPLGASDGDFSRAPYSSLWQVVPTSLLQSIASEPLRNNPAPPIVYAVYLLLLGGVVLLALRRASAIGRQSLVLALVLTQVVPLVVSAAGLRSVGLVWQGRYGLPFTAAVAVLAGVLLDRGGRGSLPARLLVPLGLVWVAVQVTACVAVFRVEAGVRVSATDPGWWQTSSAAVGVIAALGWLLLAAVPLLVRDQSEDPEVASA